MTMSGRPRCSATSNTMTTFGVARQPRRRERLAPEAGARVLVPRVPIREQLDGDGPLELGIRRAIHLTHAALRDEHGRGVPPRKHVAGDPQLVPDPRRTGTAEWSVSDNDPAAKRPASGIFARPETLREQISGLRMSLSATTRP